jgi:hypothetical protein
MRRLPAVLVALTAAAALALLASLASAAGARTCKTDPDTVRAGQTVKAYGKGCRSRGYVRIYLDRSRSTTTAPTAPACSSTTWRSPTRPTPASIALADDQAAGAAGHEGLQQTADCRRQLTRLEVDERARRRVRHVDRPPHERGTHNSRISRSVRTTHAPDRQRRPRT